MAEPLWKRNNNPGNIRDSKAGGFRTYGSLEEGMQAWRSLLNRRYFGRGLNTPKSILNTYAPPTDNNNTSAYVDFVSKRLGITPDTVLDSNNIDQMAKLASAMFKMETGHNFTPDEIKTAWSTQITPGSQATVPISYSYTENLPEWSKIMPIMDKFSSKPLNWQLPTRPQENSMLALAFSQLPQIEYQPVSYTNGQNLNWFGRQI